MPIEIEGVTYATAADVCRDLHLTRQTLWRWRKEEKVPQGHRLRGKKVLFTQSQVEAIRSYANRVEPADAPQDDQLKLFAPAPRGSGQ